MIESFSISTECILCLKNRDRVYTKLNTRLKRYDDRQVKKNDGILDRVVYEQGVLRVVKDVLAKTDPYLVNIIETKVAWGIASPIDTSVHIQMNASVRSLLKVNPAIAEVYH